MKKILKISAIFFAAFFLSACSGPQVKNQNQDDISKKLNTNNQPAKNMENKNNQQAEKTNPAEENNSYLEKYNTAVINTNYGKIKLKFYSEDAPKTVNNFFKLAEEKFYDGIKFHRVIKGFMIQGGDPNSKDNNWEDDGLGGPGYTVPAEIKMKNKRGTIATARTGDQINPKRESSGSQFYINTADNVSLDGQYTVFGEVTEGMDVVDKIENVKTNENDHPTSDVVIQRIELSKI